MPAEMQVASSLGISSLASGFLFEGLGEALGVELGELEELVQLPVAAFLDEFEFDRLAVQRAAADRRFGGRGFAFDLHVRDVHRLRRRFLPFGFFFADFGRFLAGGGLFLFVERLRSEVRCTSRGRSSSPTFRSPRRSRLLRRRRRCSSRPRRTPPGPARSAISRKGRSSRVSSQFLSDAAILTAADGSALIADSTAGEHAGSGRCSPPG